MTSTQQQPPRMADHGRRRPPALAVGAVLSPTPRRPRAASAGSVATLHLPHPSPYSAAVPSYVAVDVPPPPLPLPQPTGTPSPLALARSRFRAFRRAPWPTASAFIGAYPLAHSRRDVVLTAVAWTYFSACSFVTCLANSTADRINPNNLVPVAERRVLVDAGMTYLASVYETYVSGPRDISDWFVRLCAVLMVTRAVLSGPRAATVLRRACYVGGTMYLLRAPTVLMTVLPNPLVACESHPDPSLWRDAVQLFFQRRFSCGDVFFSGHSIVFVTAGRLWLRYGANPLARAAVALVTFAAVTSLVASSYHYSIDVWIACILTSLVFSLYHWTAEGRIGAGTWWGDLVTFLDADEALRAAACRRAARAYACVLPARNAPRRGPQRRTGGYAQLDEEEVDLEEDDLPPSYASVCDSCAAWWPAAKIPPTHRRRPRAESTDSIPTTDASSTATARVHPIPVITAAKPNDNLRVAASVPHTQQRMSQNRPRVVVGGGVGGGLSAPAEWSPRLVVERGDSGAWDGPPRAMSGEGEEGEVGEWLFGQEEEEESE
ncbi:hypothetical protein H9P43_006839 [Blastocladiella emersonii ATCC 22665]|nr:hypothetical protein H9P43_006839 [Blastocladiella emersonii ATCC 22665]